VIFGKSKFLESILGPNGKAEKLKKAEQRADAASTQLQEAVEEATQTTCDAAKQAVVILSSSRTGFDVDARLERAEKTLSCPPKRPNGTVKKPLRVVHDEDDTTPEAA
jgi:hypothetical protein